MTNFRLFQTEKCAESNFKFESSPNGYETLWEKEKMLVMSNFTFSHSVFKRLILQTRKNQGLFGIGLNYCFRNTFCCKLWL